MKLRQDAFLQIKDGYVDTARLPVKIPAGRKWRS